MTTRVLDEARQTLLRSMLNRLVPSEEGFPGAGDLALAERLEAAVAEAPGTRRLFLDGLTAVALAAARAGGTAFEALDGTAQDAVLREVEAAHPAFFEALVRHTYSAYYVHPDVLRRLGVDPRPPQPAGHDLGPPFDPALVERVRRRGPIYRPA